MKTNEEYRLLEQQNLALAAAIEAKNAALQEVADLIGESSGVYGLHLNGDPAPWEELEQGGRFERLTSLHDALVLNPSPDLLAKHDATLIRAVRGERVRVEGDWLEFCAKARESGEWNPILEVKR